MDITKAMTIYKKLMLPTVKALDAVYALRKTIYESAPAIDNSSRSTALEKTYDAQTRYMHAELVINVETAFRKEFEMFTKAFNEALLNDAYGKE